MEEGQSTNVSMDYFESEIAVWEQDGDKKNITAMDTANIIPNTPIVFEKYGVILDPVFFTNTPLRQISKNPVQLAVAVLLHYFIWNLQKIVKAFPREDCLT